MTHRLVFVLSMLVASPVRAQSPEPQVEPEVSPPPRESDLIETAPASSRSRSIDLAQKGNSEFAPPTRELQFASEMAFLTTSEDDFAGSHLKFTDLGLWRNQVTIALTQRLALSGGATLVAKQPSTSDESVWQSANLGALYGFLPHWAVSANAQISTMLGRTGLLGAGGLTLQWRSEMNDFMKFEASLGGHVVDTFPDVGESSWFVEPRAHGEAQLCWGECDRHYGASWFGIDFAVPVYHHPNGADAVLDPNNTLSAQLGSLARINETLDLYALASWIDRGDAADPATQLPVLDGGFDQVQIVVGVMAHLELGKWPQGGGDQVLAE